MLESKKHVFWQALFLTALFFLLGLVFGVYLEQGRADKVNSAFYQSEISLYDSLALTKLSEANLISCSDLREASIDFANKVYEEARILEKFDEKNRLTESVKSLHKKYDLLRTLLWMNVIDLKEKCGEMNTVVYLYEYNTEDITLKSEQNVWGKILSDLKNDKGNEIILIPIAADGDLTSLDALTEKFGIKAYPAVVINEKHIFYDLNTVEELKGYLN